MSRVLALLAWLTLALHFALGIHTFTLGAVVQSLLTFLGFFTILTNLLLALTLTALAFPHGPLRSFARPNPATATAVYAVVVELVYTAVLRWQWQPRGLQLSIDIVLHDVLPIAYFVIWWKQIPKGTLRYADAFGWLLFPLLFIPWNAFLATFVRKSPYAFLSPAAMGYPAVAGSIVLLTLMFLLLSVLLIKLDHSLAPGHAVKSV